VLTASRCQECCHYCGLVSAGWLVTVSMTPAWT